MWENDGFGIRRLGTPMSTVDPPGYDGPDEPTARSHAGHGRVFCRAAHSVGSFARSAVVAGPPKG